MNKLTLKHQKVQELLLKLFFLCCLILCYYNVVLYYTFRLVEVFNIFFKLFQSEEPYPTFAFR